MTDQQERQTVEFRQYLGYAAIGLAGVGTLMQLVTVSLLTGDTVYWVGAALALVGTVLAWLNGRLWLKIVTVLLAAACAMNVGATEQKFGDERGQIGQLFSNTQSN